MHLFKIQNDDIFLEVTKALMRPSLILVEGPVGYVIVGTRGTHTWRRNRIIRWICSEISTLN